MSTATFTNGLAWFLNMMVNNPRYAIGKVTKVNKYTLNVRLFGSTSVANPPSYFPFDDPENPTGYTDLLNVPLAYMNCTTKLFKGDEWVIVKFDGPNREAPKVIGFQDHPKHCQHENHYHIKSMAHLPEPNQNTLADKFGTWAKTPDSIYEWEDSVTRVHAGNIATTNVHGTVSWWGRRGITTGNLSFLAGRYVYHNTNRIDIGIGFTVRGAAITQILEELVEGEGEVPVKYILAISYNYATSQWRASKIKLPDYTVTAITTANLPSTEYAWYDPANNLRRYDCNPVFFNSTGRRAVALVTAGPSNLYTVTAPAVCEYVFEADLSQVTRTVGAALSIGSWSNEETGPIPNGVDIVRDEVAIKYYGACYDDADEIIVASHTRTSHYVENQADDTASFDSSITIQDQIKIGADIVAASASSDAGSLETGPTYTVTRSMALHTLDVVALDPRNRNSLVLEREDAIGAASGPPINSYGGQYPIWVEVARSLHYTADAGTTIHDKEWLSTEQLTGNVGGSGSQDYDTRMGYVGKDSGEAGWFCMASGGTGFMVVGTRSKGVDTGAIWSYASDFYVDSLELLSGQQLPQEENNDNTLQGWFIGVVK
jgi:hypothetical protein